MHLQDRVRIFHEPDCPGIITSAVDDAGRIVLRCAECRKIVGEVEAVVLAQLIDLIPT